MKPVALEIVWVPRAELNPSPYNPRRITDREAADLRASLEAFGFVEPLVVNAHPQRHNVVIGGHQRLKIAAELEIDPVPVVYVTLEEKQERELNLRLNKNLGAWDWDLFGGSGSTAAPGRRVLLRLAARASPELVVDAATAIADRSARRSRRLARCPLCGGSTLNPKQRELSLRKRQSEARRLRALGYSFRAIARALGYRSPDSIHKICRRATPCDSGKRTRPAAKRRA